MLHRWRVKTQHEVEKEKECPSYRVSPYEGSEHPASRSKRLVSSVWQ